MTDRLRPDPRFLPCPDVVSGDGYGADFGCLVNEMTDPTDGAAIVVLQMIGEIDLTTQAQVNASLRDGLRAKPRHLLVDLSQVGFCGARGFTSFADTARSAAGSRIGFALCGLTPRLDRAATTMWGRHRLIRHRSVEVAMGEIRAAHRVPD